MESVCVDVTLLVQSVCDVQVVDRCVGREVCMLRSVYIEEIVYMEKYVYMEKCVCKEVGI